ncbi:MAG: sigma factor-like helix-turn-helix DNA-binding protein [Pyramidobacter sp.]|nr:sigma factor-like helix-turn-helix DNA-binding protein [Pyramidobacter sp.]
MSETEILERRIYLSRLYDLYGPLLTERQRHVYEMHELEDLSLSEISAELEISRQGVSDQLQRVRDKLEEFEKLLGLNARLETIAHQAQILAQEGASAKPLQLILEACGRKDGETRV